MTVVFVILSMLTVASALAAMTLRNLVHCALSLAVAFAGLAALYLLLNAQFAGFAQVLVYVGAVAILIVFAVLLTRGGEPSSEVRFSPGWLTGIGVATAVLTVMTGVIVSSPFLRQSASGIPPTATVRQLGDELMTHWVLPLEVLGLLLTAALIGAVIIALPEPQAKRSGGLS
jgi:NADH-quinone oxidoreductase subunit J